MIDTKIFGLGASSITIEVSQWKPDKVTPKMFKCIIRHDGHSPSAVTAERDNALAAERECVERFMTVFEKRKRGISHVVKAKRKSDEPDEFEY